MAVMHQPSAHLQQTFTPPTIVITFMDTFDCSAYRIRPSTIKENAAELLHCSTLKLKRCNATCVFGNCCHIYGLIKLFNHLATPTIAQQISELAK